MCIRTGRPTSGKVPIKFGTYNISNGRNGRLEARGIGLVEVMWKVVVAVLNLFFISSITYHNSLHGFRAGRGTGTATLEAKLLQQLVALREEVL